MFELGKKDGTERGSATPARAPATGTDDDARPAGASAAATHREAAVIGRSIKIDGDLQGEEDLRIEGDVTGTVRLNNNTLTIGGEGRVRANVFARAVVVDGTVEGDLYGSERVAIRNNASVHGNITAPRVSLDDGAKFKGSIEMDSEAVSAALGAVAEQSKPDAKRAPVARANGGKPATNGAARNTSRVDANG